MLHHQYSRQIMNTLDASRVLILPVIEQVCGYRVLHANHGKLCKPLILNKAHNLQDPLPVQLLQVPPTSAKFCAFTHPIILARPRSSCVAIRLPPTSAGKLPPCRHFIPKTGSMAPYRKSWEINLRHQWYGTTPVGCRGGSRYVESCWGFPCLKIEK